MQKNLHQPHTLMKREEMFVLSREGLIKEKISRFLSIYGLKKTNKNTIRYINRIRICNKVTLTEPCFTSCKILITGE